MKMEDFSAILDAAVEEIGTIYNIADLSGSVVAVTDTDEIMLLVQNAKLEWRVEHLGRRLDGKEHAYRNVIGFLQEGMK